MGEKGGGLSFNQFVWSFYFPPPNNPNWGLVFDEVRDMPNNNFGLVLRRPDAS